MPRGTQVQRSYIYAKIVGTKKGETCPVEFVFTRKQGDEYVEIDRQQDFSGHLVSVAMKTFTFQDEEKETVELKLDDGTDVYILNVNFSNIGRSIINSIASIEDFGKELLISCYRNKAGYASASCRYGLGSLDWKYPLSDIPKIKTVTVGKKEVVDSTELDDFFRNEVNAISKRLGEYMATALPVAPVGTATGVMSQELTAGKVVKDMMPESIHSSQIPEDDDDLPF